MSPPKNAPISTSIDLTRSEVKTLITIARYHERAMGPMRYLFKFGASKDIRAKYKFLAEEGELLERFAEATHADLVAARKERDVVRFTPAALVSFWGRLLASLNSPRSRRKLSEGELEGREALAGKLESAASQLWRDRRPALDEVLSTRRRREAQWMRDRLEP